MAEKHTRFNRGPINSVSWSSIWVGLAVSLLAFFTMTVLGVAFGGIALSDLEGFTAFSWGAAIWSILSGMLALFFGGFVTSRVSNFVSARAGTAQALTVSALFFVLLMSSGGAMIGAIGGTVTSSAQAIMPGTENAGQALQKLAQNEEIQNMGREKLLELGVQPAEVDDILVTVVSRLLSGNVESAKNYLEQKTDLERGQIDPTLNEIEQTVTAEAENLAQSAAMAFSAVGWFLFLMLVLSTGSGVAGGIMGTKRNEKRNLEDEERAHTNRAA